MRLALFEPDIPQNTGAILRLCACWGIAVDLIEPFGFLWGDRQLKRAGMDYLDQAQITHHTSWARFCADRPQGRLVLATTRGSVAHHRFAFRAGDTLLFGAESRGVPPAVHETADARVKIPMREGLRSINVALSAAIIVAEALRQLEAWPKEKE